MSISSRSCTPDIILPGETTYFQGIGTYTGTATINLVATPHPTIKNARNAECIRYSVQNVSFVNDNIFSFKAIGELVNNTSKEASSFSTVAIQLFKKDGTYFATMAKTLLARAFLQAVLLALMQPIPIWCIGQTLQKKISENTNVLLTNLRLHFRYKIFFVF